MILKGMKERTKENSNMQQVMNWHLYPLGDQYQESP